MAADKILEGPWWDVVIKDLNLMSYYFARELGLETKGTVDKGTYELSFEEWPPMRLMSLNLILSYWLGWISPTHGLWDGLNAIQQAYTAGLNVFLQSDEGKKLLRSDKGKKWLQSPQGKQWQQQQRQEQQGQQVASKPAETEGTQQQQSNAKTEGTT